MEESAEGKGDLAESSNTDLRHVRGCALAGSTPSLTHTHKKIKNTPSFRDEVMKAKVTPRLQFHHDVKYGLEKK